MTVAAELDPDPMLAGLAASSRPRMTLDPAAVLGAAHRHTTRRAARRVGGGVAALAATCAVAVNVAGAGMHSSQTPAWRTAGPTSTDQVAQSIGAGDLATIADGVRAVNVPGPAQTPSTGAKAALPGATAERDLALVGPAGTSVVLLTSDPGAKGTASLRVTYADASGTPVRSGPRLPSWTWDDSASANKATWASVTSDASHRLDAALLPADLKSPHAVYWIKDDAGTRWQEVPTFDTGNGRLATVFTTTGVLPKAAGLAFVDVDGRIVEAPCPATIHCSGVDTAPGLEDYLEQHTIPGQPLSQESFTLTDQAVDDAERQLAEATTAAERAAAETALAKARANLDTVTVAGG